MLIFDVLPHFYVHIPCDYDVFYCSLVFCQSLWKVLFFLMLLHSAVIITMGALWATSVVMYVEHLSVSSIRAA